MAGLCAAGAWREALAPKHHRGQQRVGITTVLVQHTRPRANKSCGHGLVSFLPLAVAAFRPRGERGEGCDNAAAAVAEMGHQQHGKSWRKRAQVEDIYSGERLSPLIFICVWHSGCLVSHERGGQDGSVSESLSLPATCVRETGRARSVDAWKER